MTAEPTLGQRATRGALLLATRNVAVRILGFVGNLVLAGLLAPADFGLLALALALMTIGGFASDAGVGAALVQRREEPVRAELSAVLGFQLAIGVALALLTLALSIPLGANALVASVMVSGACITAFRVPNLLLLERELNFGPMALADVIDALVYNCLAVGLVAAGAGVWGVAIATATRALVGTIYLARRGPAGLVLPSLQWRRLKPILRFGVKFQSVGIVSLLRDQGSSFTIGAIGGLGVLGIAVLANRLLQVVSLVLESLYRISFPVMSQFVRERETAAHGSAIDRAVRLTAVGVAVGVVGLMAGAPSLVMLLGDEWSDTLLLVPWLCWGLLIVGPIAVGCGGYLYAVGDTTTVLRSAIIHTVVGMVVSLPLLPLVGVQAIGYASLLTCVVEAVIIGRAASSRTNWRFAPSLLAITAQVGVVATAAFFAAKEFDGSLLISCGIIITAELVTFGGLALVARSALADFLATLRAALPNRIRIRFQHPA